MAEECVEVANTEELCPSWRWLQDGLLVETTTGWFANEETDANNFLGAAGSNKGISKSWLRRQSS